VTELLVRMSAVLLLAMASLLIGCGRFASIERRYVSVKDLTELQLGTISTLSSSLAGFTRMNQSHTPGVVEAYGTGTDEKNGPYASLPGSEHVFVWLLRSPGDAQRMFGSACSFHSEGLKVDDVRHESGEGWETCLGPVAQERADPEGLRLPTDQYTSFAVIRRDSVMIEIWELRGRYSAGSMDRIIEDLAQRLRS
jgi:hypothetical protein